MPEQCEANAVTLKGSVNESGRENDTEDEKDSQQQKHLFS